MSVLRVAVVNEAVHGHRVVQARLEDLFGETPGVHATFDVVPPPGRAESVLLRRVRPLGSLDLQPLRWRMRYSAQARRMIRRREQEADVVMLNTQACALLAPRRRPYVVTVDCTWRQFSVLEYWSPRDRMSSVADRPLDVLERRALRGAAAVVAWTDWAARSVIEDYGVDPARVEAFHLGVDVQRWSGLQRNASLTRLLQGCPGLSLITPDGQEPGFRDQGERPLVRGFAG